MPGFSPSVLGGGNHAGRPSAASLPDGSTYACSEHNLLYQVAAGAWGTSLSGGDPSPADIIDIPTAETDSALVLGPDGLGGVHFRAETGGGGGGATIKYPPLKPATPTYDFDGASLPGAFSAYSQTGAFGTGHALTQAIDGSHLNLMFSAQLGGIYVAHANTDFDFEVGGIYPLGLATSNYMFGIAALNAVGTGVGVTSYQDNNGYICTITTYSYTTNSNSWNQGGYNTSPNGRWAMRLKRVGGTWTAYMSKSGRAWDNTFTTRADVITVDKLVFGLLYNPGFAFTGQLVADYFHVSV